MGLTDLATGEPYMNVIFGNFYSPAFDDETFIDDTMRMIKELGFNSVMFDTKAWEDFKERYETSALSQYVKMQEYMGKSALEHELYYNFLLLYLNGDNLYPHIRFSPPIFGEETVDFDGTPGKWYKYWSAKAQASMREHVERIMERYGQGCARCNHTGSETNEVIPVCSMWDPIVAPSFDEEGKKRYRDFLKTSYQNDISRLNQCYKLKLTDFSEITPEEYWYTLKYGEEDFYSEEDVLHQSGKFLRWRDNARWKIEELKQYFQVMQSELKKENPNLFLCPDMTQWGYFLNIFGRSQEDLDNDFSELWDTAMRGIDIYALAPYVDSCHFITVPTTPDGTPDAYVVSCGHSMMRVMNEGKTMIGGIYWGRFIYQDLYALLSPAEIIGTMTACGMDGYTCYGMNGLDDGGVMNRMNESFLESLKLGNAWAKEIISLRKGVRKKEIALLFPSEMAHYEPFEVGNNKIRRLDLLGWYKICCDLGYQTDVISSHEIEKGKLEDYRILIVPANDCYLCEEHAETEQRMKEWVLQGGVLLHGPSDGLAKSCFGIEGEPCQKNPFRYGKVIIPQGEKFCSYRHGEPVADYVDDGGCCIVKLEGNQLNQFMEKDNTETAWRGAVYSFGVQLGASYAAKNIPHVPYEQGNKEMYPIIQSKTTLVKDILSKYIKPESGIAERGIETGIFENGMVIINHRATPYILPKNYEMERYQYQAGRSGEGRGVLIPHSAVWVSLS